MSVSDTYQVYCVKYATMQNRYRRDNFIMADNHDTLMPLDYYVWALVNKERTIVVDTGFTPAEGDKRGRNVLRLPRDGLAMLGIDASKVKDVIVTHMHYDHAGTLDHFPSAKFHINQLEMAFTTGPMMCHDPFRHSMTVEHVCSMVKSLFEGRVAFYSGDQEIYPGVSVHHIGGHTPGMMSVRVKTKRGWLVLASDAAHFYEEMERSKPFVVVYNMDDMIKGWSKLKALAESNRHVIPGHDPLVMHQYPAPKAALQGIVVRLDVEPKR